MESSSGEAGEPDPATAALSPAEEAAAKRVAATVLVLMGVSGSGKTTIAQELHRLLRWQFKEGDDLHPPANVEKMRAGHPLNDEDRKPWLTAVAQWIDARRAAGEPGIITCSNLKRAYRRITVNGRTGVTLVYLKGDETLIAERIARRRHRNMPASLLHSQFETLEEPGADEHALVVPLEPTVAATVLDLLHKLAAAQAAAGRAPPG